MNVRLTRWYPADKYLPKLAGWYLVSHMRPFWGNNQPGQFFWFDPKYPDYFWFGPAGPNEGAKFNCFKVTNHKWCGVKR